MSINTVKNRQFKCNSCGGQLELQNKRTQYVACPYCGSVADASSDAFKVLTKNENPSNFSPRSFLKIGLVGKLRNQTYKIIGRTCWKSTYQEFWEEEGEQGYSNETWTFDDWLLINEDGGYLSIIEDAEGYYFSESVIPKYPSLPSGTSMNDFDTNNPQIVREYGSSEIMYFEGESTYQIDVGSKASFSQYTIGQTDFIAEWRVDEQEKVKEIEFFRESPVSKGFLQAAFTSEEGKEKLIADYNAKVKLRKTNKRIFLFTGLANLILGIVLFVVAGGGQSNTVLQYDFKGSSALKISPENKVDTTEYYLIKADEQFTIAPESKALGVSLISTVPDMAEVIYKLQILDGKGEIVFEEAAFACSLKRYKDNYDAVVDGSFKEIYVLDKQSGLYKAQVVLEVPKRQAAYLVSNIGANVEIATLEESHDSGMFVGFGVLMIFISFFIRKPKNKFNFWNA